ncbi:Ca2+-dependent phosphoinositide-specific phospholipase C [Chondromyces apiculatus]|uniref:Xylanase n=1 Tax=Chondromyces apiculatus DSM 436 TaxID=1192034 RepID=A0A017T1E0_9BACT|nr:Ca2+-dependent phosphoinositide-specific phospholipase C [Chondromyces apiculatus]EYF02660.1 xylanase [Chondromyces apiculatus DSM 436]
MHPKTLRHGLFGFVTGLLAASSAGEALANAPSAGSIHGSLPYDRAYFARPHNTYNPSKFGNLEDALQLGFRALEIDIHEFPNFYFQFPVKHSAGDPDNANNCQGDLRACLAKIRTWSNAHPGHEPITLQIDLKVGVSNAFVAWSDLQHSILHHQIGEELGTKLFRPRDLQDFTQYDNIRAGVYFKGWPTIDALRGKVIVLIMGGPINDKNDNQENYVRIHQGDANFFVCPNAGSAGDFTYHGNADDFDEYDTNKWVICGNVEAGSGWRHLANSANNNRQLMNLWGGSLFDQFHTMYLAVGWGASMISRESFNTFGGKLPYMGVRRSVPVEFNLANENSGLCLDVANASYQNGSDIIQFHCNSDANQRWIYTDETQLLSKGNNAYCYDIDSGDGDRGDKHHIWRCDGGASEKWRLQEDGSWVGKENRCMDVPNSSTSPGVQLWHYDCNGTSAQRFDIF